MFRLLAFLGAICAAPPHRAVREHEAWLTAERPARRARSYRAAEGLTVTRRDAAGLATEGKLRVLVDNPDSKVYVVGPFNNWQPTPAHQLHAVSEAGHQGIYFEGKLPITQQGMPYRLVVNGKQLLDPASPAFTAKDYLNSVAWDFEAPGHYRMKHRAPDLRGKPQLVVEEDLYNLLRHWKGGSVLARDGTQTYALAARSGIFKQLRAWGYNAIELPPVTQSVDGSRWWWRFLTYGAFAPDASKGSPEDFMKAVDAANEAGLAVIVNFVPHYPERGNEGIRLLDDVGLTQWLKKGGARLFGSGRTPWKTSYYDLENPFVRRFLVDSMLTFATRYRVAGIRLDNYVGWADGFRKAPGGQDFVRELRQALRDHAPWVQLYPEVHSHFHPFITQRTDRGGDGMHARNNGEYYDWFTNNFQRATEKVDMSWLSHVLHDPWRRGDLGRRNYSVNHDEAANPRDNAPAAGRYLASTLGGPGAPSVRGKIVAFEALAMTMGWHHLGMLHSALLQEGNYSHNPEVDWSLLAKPDSRRTHLALARLRRYVRDQRAFNFANLNPAIENHIDHDNKVVSLRRVDRDTGKTIYVVINLGHQRLSGYRFGVDRAGEFRIPVDTDRPEYGGSGALAAASGGKIVATATPLHSKPASLEVPVLAPYGVVVLESRPAPSAPAAAP